MKTYVSGKKMYRSFLLNKFNLKKKVWGSFMAVSPEDVFWYIVTAGMVLGMLCMFVVLMVWCCTAKEEEDHGAMQTIYSKGYDLKIGNKVFQYFDKNKSGKLEREEALTFFYTIYKFLKNIKFNIPEDKKTWVLQCLSYFDKEGNHILTYNDFMDAIKLIDNDSGDALRTTIEQTISSNMIFNGSLKEKVREYLKMLQIISSNGSWKDPSFVENSVCRYLQWLHLRIKLKAAIPIPDDIKFILHVHMLHPVAYRQVLKNLIYLYSPNIELLAKQEPNEEEISAFENAWDVEYQENVNEPSQKEWKKFENLLHVECWEVDFLKSTLGQAQFLEKLLRLTDNNFEILLTDKFLDRALIDYRKFLYLRKIAPEDSYIVPSMFIDLLWHSHMLSPYHYYNDSLFLVGFLLDHNDNLEDQVLKKDWKNTHTIWRKHYGEPLVAHNIKAYLDSPTSFGFGKFSGSTKKHVKVNVEDSETSLSESFSDDSSEVRQMSILPSLMANCGALGGATCAATCAAGGNNSGGGGGGCGG